jgi:hypothetical protein
VPLSGGGTEGRSVTHARARAQERLDAPRRLYVILRPGSRSLPVGSARFTLPRSE